MDAKSTGKSNQIFTDTQSTSTQNICETQKVNSNFTVDESVRHFLTTWPKSTSPVTKPHMCLQISCPGKNSASLSDVPTKWHHLRTHEETLCKTQLRESPQNNWLMPLKCKCHEKKRSLKKCPRLKETKETRQLDTTHQLGFTLTIKNIIETTGKNLNKSQDSILILTQFSFSDVHNYNTVK